MTIEWLNVTGDARRTEFKYREQVHDVKERAAAAELRDDATRVDPIKLIKLIFPAAVITIYNP